MADIQCGGHCCRAFPIGVPAEMLADIRAAVQRGDTRYVFEGREYVFDAELIQILEMLIPLGRHEVNPISGVQYPEPQDLYTCRNFDPETSLCKAYETRPTMCRNYPYGNPCEYTQCAGRKLECASSLSHEMCKEA